MRVQTMVVVAKLGRSGSFYAGALGFGVLWRHEHIALLERGPMLLYLATQGPSTPDVSLEPPDRPRRLPSSRCATAPRRTRSLSSVGCGVLRLAARAGLRCFARYPDGYLAEVEQPPEG